MPRAAATQALIGVIALIIAIALAVVPAVDARPKDKNGGKKGNVSEEAVPTEESTDESSAPVAQDLATSATGNEHTLLDLDSDGDYIPDAFDNCSSVQNPDQGDGDGDGTGDACTAQIDSDGDSRPDKGDNCPNVATADQTDSDGDGIGDVCDKSPDGVEPTPEPPADYAVDGGGESTELPPPENGAGEDGVAVERPGRARSMERQRTERSRPIITLGVDGETATGDEQVEEISTELPPEDEATDTQELIAEPEVSGELFATDDVTESSGPASDERESSTISSWTSVLRIDAGSEDDQAPVDAETLDSPAATTDGELRTITEALSAGQAHVADSQFARGWVRAKLLLQEEENQGEQGDPEPRVKRQRVKADRPQVSAPVPVENGLVITGPQPGDAELLDPRQDLAPNADVESQDGVRRASATQLAEMRDAPAANDESRRNGTSRAAAATTTQQLSSAAPSEEDTKQKKKRRARKTQSGPEEWTADEYYDGGSALDWGGDIDIVSTDNDALYLTQRSGSGTGKRRGFSYAIPLESDGTYLVRLYFAEPYWGAPGGPEGAPGQRVFSVIAEDRRVFSDVDIFAEAGALSALVAEAEVDVQDGELNLQFVGSEGEPIVAAIEVLAPDE